MTPSEIITDVRVLINDTDSTSYRYTDTSLLAFVNDALQRMSLLRPDLFSIFADIVCTQNAVVQSAPSDCLRMMEVMRVVSGNALYESNRETMDQNAPTWPTDTAAAAITWMRHPRSQTQFFIYPQAPAAQSITIEYAQIPPTYLIGDTITLVRGYETALIDCVVWLSQSIDDEHVSSGRAKMFLESFTQSLGISAQQRVATDTEPAGLPPKATV